MDEVSIWATIGGVAVTVITAVATKVAEWAVEELKNKRRKKKEKNGKR